ncbi:uncharacterized protein K02A2.6-like [Stylophora pistillata]|uniref:uncharacterized protein K02A2.6-like n=1 Tax=Stylophora pistillata TaxID=50429 RepID=UPI000C0460F5|nr:uncharacterized protein K02A2.6-like [Stylophora pistillata]
MDWEQFFSNCRTTNGGTLQMLRDATHKRKRKRWPWTVSTARRLDCDTTESQEISLRSSSRGTPGKRVDKEQTKSRLRTKVWWPKVDMDVKRMCKSCHSCQVVGQYSPSEPMLKTKPPTGPWQDVAADLMGPLPTSKSLLVVVDYYSRYYEVSVMRLTTTPKIIIALREIFSRFGNPHSLKTDNGPQFVSKEFEEFSRECGIEHRRSPALWPQANGEVE